VRPFLRKGPLLILLIAAFGCTPPDVPLGAPDGWNEHADRWWKVDADTAMVFRDLSSFDAMGYPLTDVVYGRGQATYQEQVLNAVKDKLFRMYQNEPHVVDSLFNQHARDRVLRGTTQSRSADAARELGAEVYKVLVRHFRQPYPKYKLASPKAARRDPELVPVIYPDSLRNQGIGGKVNLQIYLNPDGEPLAIKRLNTIHPLLDNFAMQATTQMRWHPVYLHGEPIYGWAFFNVIFKAPMAS
jgi:hypothetical protein